MKEYANGGKTTSKHFFSYRLSSFRMVIECAFGRLKARVGCIRRNMDINMKDLPAVIQACFILHNFCELNGKTVNQGLVLQAQQSDSDFQPPLTTGYSSNTNESNGKKIQKVFTSYFE